MSKELRSFVAKNKVLLYYSLFLTLLFAGEVWLFLRTVNERPVVAWTSLIVVTFVWLLSFRGLWGRERQVGAVHSFLGIVSAFAAGAAAVVAYQQAHLLSQQIELENRPFVSIERVQWGYQPGNDWFASAFERKNYGTRPAEELRFRNFRAIVLELDKRGIEERITARISDGLSERLEQYVLDERNKIILHTMRLLADYFRRCPDASKSDVQGFLGGLKDGSEEFKEHEILLYQERPVFRLLRVNSDMDEYRRWQRHMIFPSQVLPVVMSLELSGAQIESVIKGDNLLVVYWAISYKDVRKAKEYSSFHLGYGASGISQLLNPGADEGMRWFALQEFHSWGSEEEVKR